MKETLMNPRKLILLRTIVALEPIPRPTFRYSARADARGSGGFWGRLLVVSAVWIGPAVTAEPDSFYRPTHIRVGHGQSIVGVRVNPAASPARATRSLRQFPYPRPRLSGFSPLVAITTSDKRRPVLDFEHDLHYSYVGYALNYPADQNFVIGYLDSGAAPDLAAGSYADILGLSGFNLSPNPSPIAGVGGTVDGYISYPIGYFAAGLSAVNANGTLDLGAVVGHSNVATVVAPEVNCGNGEILTAVVGLPLMSFFNSIIRIDDPRTVTVHGETFTGPDVQIQDQMYLLPEYARKVAMEFAGGFPATTAGYYAAFDPFEPGSEEDPTSPTLLTVAAGFLPTGGAFLATLFVIEGEPGPTNPAQPMRVLVDTGAQSSIMSEAMAANLSLPFEPDFKADVCGVGGLVTDVDGYYVDYVKINARGGALEFSRAPFVVVDLPSPEGGTLDGVLGMNFFWNRNVIFEPALGLDGKSAFLHLSDPIPFAYGDFDLDFYVDMEDIPSFVSCMSGPGVQPVSPECDHVDADESGTVDLFDFAQFQLCFRGADTIADPACGH